MALPLWKVLALQCTLIQPHRLWVVKVKRIAKGGYFAPNQSWPKQRGACEREHRPKVETGS